MTSALEYIFGPSIYRRAFFFKDMKNFIINILIITALLILNAGTVRAQSISNSSATIKNGVADSGFDYRAENLRNFLEKYNSPLAAYADDFVTYADMNGLDYRLVPAISGVESTFGKFIPNNSFNAYGWANGEYTFMSWEDSIAHVSETLKSAYIDKGAPTIAKIAKRYAPPSTTWGNGVKFFVGKIDSLPLNFDIVI
jgi:hypothetical protein